MTYALEVRALSFYTYRCNNLTETEYYSYYFLMPFVRALQRKGNRKKGGTGEGV